MCGGLVEASRQSRSLLRGLSVDQPGHLIWRAAARVIGRPRPGHCLPASTSTRTPPCWRSPTGQTRSQQSLADSDRRQPDHDGQGGRPALAEQGLVERVRNPDDRRSYALTRTPEGAAAARRWRGMRGPRGGAHRRFHRSPSGRSSAVCMLRVAQPASWPRRPPSPLLESLGVPHHADPLVRMHARVLDDGARDPWGSSPAHSGSLVALASDRARSPQAELGPAARHQRRQRRARSSTTSSARAGRATPPRHRPAHPGAAPPARRRGGGHRGQGTCHERSPTDVLAPLSAPSAAAAHHAPAALRHRRLRTIRQRSRASGNIRVRQPVQRLGDAARRPRGPPSRRDPGATAARRRPPRRRRGRSGRRRAFLRAQRAGARRTPHPRAARGAAPGACRSRRPGRRHRRRSSGRSSRSPTRGSRPATVRVALARRCDRRRAMSNAVVS